MQNKTQNIKSVANVEIKIQIELTEIEARALLAFGLYGHKNFLGVFYKHLGTCYVQPYEKGVISLFETAKKELPIHLTRADNARKAFNEQ